MQVHLEVEQEGQCKEDQDSVLEHLEVEVEVEQE